MRENLPIRAEGDEYVLVLDGINDPGNLGTIIRIADWYGITKIVCSLDTVEYTNPKVIMASMGSFLRVSLYYTDLAECCNSIISIHNLQKLDIVFEGSWCRFSP
jgi:RNA methyltransferase, TrmH family